MTEQKCIPFETHKFVFLRQETRNEGAARNPNWVVYDLFFCEKCMAIERCKIDANYREYDGPKNEAVR